MKDLKLVNFRKELLNEEPLDKEMKSRVGEATRGAKGMFPNENSPHHPSNVKKAIEKYIDNKEGLSKEEIDERKNYVSYLSNIFTDPKFDMSSQRKAKNEYGKVLRLPSEEKISDIGDKEFFNDYNTNFKKDGTTASKTDTTPTPASSLEANTAPIAVGAESPKTEPETSPAGIQRYTVQQAISKIEELKKKTMDDLAAKIDKYESSPGFEKDSMARANVNKMKNVLAGTGAKFDKLKKQASAGTINANNAVGPAENLAATSKYSMNQKSLKGFIRRDIQFAKDSLSNTKDRISATAKRAKEAIKNSKTAETVGKVKRKMGEVGEFIGQRAVDSNEKEDLAMKSDAEKTSQREMIKVLGQEKAQQYSDAIDKKDTATKADLEKELLVAKRRTDRATPTVGQQVVGTAKNVGSSLARGARAIKSRITSGTKTPAGSTITIAPKVDTPTATNPVVQPTVAPQPAGTFAGAMPNAAPPPEVVKAGLQASWKIAKNDKQRQNVINMANAKLNPANAQKAVGEATKLVHNNILNW